MFINILIFLVFLFVCFVVLFGFVHFSYISELLSIQVYVLWIVLLKF